MDGKRLIARAAFTLSALAGAVVVLVAFFPSSERHAVISSESAL